MSTANQPAASSTALNVNGYGRLRSGSATWFNLLEGAQKRGPTGLGEAVEGVSWPDGDRRWSWSQKLQIPPWASVPAPSKTSPHPFKPLTQRIWFHRPSIGHYSFGGWDGG
jgi:hypothetical protein